MRSSVLSLRSRDKLPAVEKAHALKGSLIIYNIRHNTHALMVLDGIFYKHVSECLGNNIDMNECKHSIVNMLDVRT